MVRYKDVTKSVNFKSSNASVVEVDASGKLVAQDKKGTATVTITKDKQSLNIPVEVTERDWLITRSTRWKWTRNMTMVASFLEDSKKKTRKVNNR
ncbi:Ig-like domain-containing protein [Bacillus pacificus]